MGKKIWNEISYIHFTVEGVNENGKTLIATKSNISKELFDHEGEVPVFEAKRAIWNLINSAKETNLEDVKGKELNIDMDFNIKQKKQIVMLGIENKWVWRMFNRLYEKSIEGLTKEEISKLTIEMLKEDLDATFEQMGEGK